MDANARGATDINFQTCDITTLSCRMQGTSYSSPAVAGAMAALLQAYPGLTPQQVVDLFLRSASDRGTPGINPVWGRGRADLGRVFSPIGPLRIAMPSGETTTELAPIGEARQAFGGAITSAGAWSSVGFDHYGRTFSTSHLEQRPSKSFRSPTLRVTNLRLTSEACHGQRNQAVPLAECDRHRVCVEQMESIRSPA